jgi:hypothetical protein
MILLLTEVEKRLLAVGHWLLAMNDGYSASKAKSK